MKKNNFLISTVYILLLGNWVNCFASEVMYKNISVTIPDSWKIGNSVIYDTTNAKVGELIPKSEWTYATGSKFIEAYRNGFEDDEPNDKFVKSGSKGNIYWVCRTVEYEDGKGGAGIWYPRIFWVNGTIIVLYSYKNCDDNFKIAVDIASTVHEK